MDKSTLRERVERRRAWMNNDETTIMARSKLCMGTPLTEAESEKLFKYLRRLELSLDKALGK